MSPAYAATTFSVPVGKVVVTSVAVLPLIAAVPRTVLPFRNDTVPVGKAAPCWTTVAIKLIELPGVALCGLMAPPEIIIEVALVDLLTVN